MAGAAVALGIGAALLTKLIDIQTWTLRNVDTQESLSGQFPSQDNDQSSTANWGGIDSLNSQSPILSYLHGDSDKLKLASLFYRRDLLDPVPAAQLSTLGRWTRRDAKLGRPPVLRLAIGDGRAFNSEVVLTQISGISYSSPDFTGAIRSVDFSMEFLRFTRFSLSDEEVTDTRYHRTAEGETYELIAAKEYGQPLLGDAIRKQNEQRGKGLLLPGDVVKLPSIAGLREVAIEPTSAILSGMLGKREAAQRTLRNATLERLGGDRNLFGPGEQ